MIKATNNTIFSYGGLSLETLPTQLSLARSDEKMKKGTREKHALGTGIIKKANRTLIEGEHVPLKIISVVTI